MNAIMPLRIRWSQLSRLCNSHWNFKSTGVLSRSLKITMCSETQIVPNLTVDDSEAKTNVTKEGKAEIIVPSSKNVFYNPVQEFNRDLSVAVLSLIAEDHIKRSRENHGVKTEGDGEKEMDVLLNQLEAGKKYEDGLVILEALSATGLRSMRYAKEIPGVKQIIANDLSENAVSSIRKNIIHNGVEHLVEASHDDAVMVMYRHKPRTMKFHAVDLDPYGCPAMFLDAAVQCVRDDGLLLVTSTDMAVLAGNTPETCYAKYGAVSLKIKACHEMALRIVLQCIQAHANRHGRYIVPLLSLSADFYVRVFVKIYTGPAKCKRTTSKLSWVYRCVGCDTCYLQPLGMIKAETPNQPKYCLPHGPPVGPTCEHCGQKYQVGGPIWSGGLHDPSFVSRLELLSSQGEFGTRKRMRGVLAVVQEELNDVPLYYTLDKLFATVRCEPMSMLQFRSALLNAGYRVSISHAHRSSIKTDAPPLVVWDIVRTWEKDHPVRRDRLSPAGLRILSKEPTTKISFDIHPDANPRSRQSKLVRFQENPLPNWGPGTRARTNISDGDVASKKKLNQGKRSRSESQSPNCKKKTSNNTCVGTEEVTE